MEGPSGIGTTNDTASGGLQRSATHKVTAFRGKASTCFGCCENCTFYLRGTIVNPMKETSKTFQKIIVAYDDSPAARDALNAGIELCKLLGTPLQTITVIEPPSVYTGLIVTVSPDPAQGIEADRRRYYRELMEFAVAEGRRHSVEVTGHLVEAEEVDGVISFLRANRADLLVIGLRQHSPHVARLWSNVSSLEERAPCSSFSSRNARRELTGNGGQRGR
jgi:nucleotide-binding universal stress UspA family protein